MIDMNDYHEDFKKQKQMLRKWAAGIAPPAGFEARLRTQLENITRSFWGEVSAIIPKLAPVALAIILLLIFLLPKQEENNNLSAAANSGDALDSWIWLENVEQVSAEMLLVQTWDLIATAESEKFISH